MGSHTEHNVGPAPNLRLRERSWQSTSDFLSPFLPLPLSRSLFHFLSVCNSLSHPHTLSYDLRLRERAELGAFGHVCVDPVRVHLYIQEKRYINR